MASLENVAVKDSYTSLLKLSGNTDTLVAGDGSNAIQVVDGNGDASPLYLNTDKIGIGTNAPASFDSEANNLVVGDGSGDNGITIFTGSSAGHHGSIFFGDATGTPKQGQIRYEQNNEVMSFHTNTIERVRIDLNGNVAIGSSSPTHAKMEIIGDADAFQLTMSDVADSDNTTKEARMGMLHYKSAEEPVTLFYAQSGSSTNDIYIGGGTGVGNHATSVAIATASTYNSISTTTNMKIDNNSRISLSNNDDGTGGQDSTSANTILGYLAGANIGSEAHTNVLIGHKSGNAMIGGRENVAIGVGALDADQYGEYSIAIGASALGAQNDSSNSADDGMSNIGIGRLSGSNISNGQYNICIGESSGSTGTNNLTTGDKNVLVGRLSGSGSADAQNRIAIGHEVTGQTDNSVTLGNADVTDVYMSQDSQAYVHAQNVPNHVANTMSSPYYRFDGSNDQVSLSSSALDFKSTNWSVSGWIYHQDSNSSHAGVISRRDEGGTEVQLIIIDSNSKLSSWNGGSAVYSTGTIPDQQWTHIVFIQDGTNKLFYINGTFDSTHTNSVSSQTCTSNVDIILGNGHTNDHDGGSADNAYPFLGQITGMKLWNKSLTATEVKDDYSGASVPFKYKGANQTDLIEANDAGSGTAWTGASGATPPDGWTAGGSGRDYLIDSSSGSGAEPALKMTAGTGNAFIRQNWNTVKGKRYRVEFIYKNTAGDVLQYDTQGGSGTITDLADSTSWSSVQKIEWTGHGGTDLIFFAKSTGDIVWVDNVSITQIGAVAEYDGSGIASDKWMDKSGNDLHGTVSGSTVENAPTGDDGLVYEEGTWNCAIFQGPNQITFADQVATYIRVGSKVTVFFSVEDKTTSGTPTTGQLQVRNLPYATKAGRRYQGSTVSFSGGISFSNQGSPPVLHCGGNSSIANIYAGNHDGNAYTNAVIDAVGANSYFAFSLTYEVA